VDVRAAVAQPCRRPLNIETVDLEGPRAGEVLIEIKATGICHTDEFTRSGADPEGLFPAILGHEGAGVVVDVGAGVTSVRKGDHVIPLYTPECRQCKALPIPQDQPLHGDSRDAGQGADARRQQPLLAERSASATTTWMLDVREFHRVAEIAVAKIRDDAPFDKVCYIGCGVTTGIGAVINTAKVEPGSNVVVFGLGGIGLNVVQGARMAGANMIVGVDLNPARETLARKFGLTHFVNPRDVGATSCRILVDLTGGGPTTASSASATSTSCARRSSAVIAAGACR